MHEMSLAEGVLQIIEETARREGARRVKQVVLEIGRLSSVEASALAFCFDVVTRGSVAEGAELVIDEIPGSGWCMPCGKTVAIGERYAPCPLCGGFQVEPTGGTRMQVREIGIE